MAGWDDTTNIIDYDGLLPTGPGALRDLTPTTPGVVEFINSIVNNELIALAWLVPDTETGCYVYRKKSGGEFYLAEQLSVLHNVYQLDYVDRALKPDDYTYYVKSIPNEYLSTETTVTFEGISSVIYVELDTVTGGWTTITNSAKAVSDNYHQKDPGTGTETASDQTTLAIKTYTLHEWHPPGVVIGANDVQLSINLIP